MLGRHFDEKDMLVSKVRKYCFFFRYSILWDFFSIQLSHSLRFKVISLRKREEIRNRKRNLAHWKRASMFAAGEDKIDDRIWFSNFKFRVRAYKVSQSFLFQAFVAFILKTFAKNADASCWKYTCFRVYGICNMRTPHRCTDARRPMWWRKNENVNANRWV